MDAIETLTIRKDDKIIFAWAEYDQSPEDPSEWLGVTLHHYGHRMKGYDPSWRDHYEPNNPAHRIVGCFQHGSIMWFIEEPGLNGYPHNCPFDSARSAGYASFSDDIDPVYHEGILETYNSWLNGEVYLLGYEIYKYNEVCGESWEAYRHSTLGSIEEEIHSDVYSNNLEKELLIFLQDNGVIEGEKVEESLSN